MKLDEMGYRYTVNELCYLTELYGSGWMGKALKAEADNDRAHTASVLEKAGLITKIEDSVCVEKVTDVLIRSICGCEMCIGVGTDALVFKCEKALLLLLINGSDTVLKVISGAEKQDEADRLFKTTDAEITVYYPEDDRFGSIAYDALRENLGVL